MNPYSRLVPAMSPSFNSVEQNSFKQVRHADNDFVHAEKMENRQDQKGPGDHHGPSSPVERPFSQSLLKTRPFDRAFMEDLRPGFIEGSRLRTQAGCSKLFFRVHNLRQRVSSFSRGRSGPRTWAMRTLAVWLPMSTEEKVVCIGIITRGLLHFQAPKPPPFPQKESAPE